MGEQMYVVEGGMGRLVARAASTRQAVSRARRRYGTICEPLAAHAATTSELREHLTGGAVFFERDGEIMPRDRAHAIVKAMETFP